MAYVVASIDSAMPGFVRSLRGNWDGRVFHDPIQKVRVAFLTTRREDAQVELVEPAGDDSPVLRFLLEDTNGVPSVAAMVRLPAPNSSGNPAPTISLITPNTGTTNG